MKLLFWIKLWSTINIINTKKILKNYAVRSGECHLPIRLKFYYFLSIEPKRNGMCSVKLLFAFLGLTFGVLFAFFIFHHVLLDSSTLVIFGKYKDSVTPMKTRIFSSTFVSSTELVVVLCFERQSNDLPVN